MMLGDACGECSIVVGSDCVPCPNGADFPECYGCTDGMRPERTDVTRDLLIPIAIGVVTTLTIAYVTHKLSRP